MFAGSGAEAMALVAQQSFDIVVSDMRMPKMTGVEFLKQVALPYPQTMQLVLSAF